MSVTVCPASDRSFLVRAAGAGTLALEDVRRLTRALHGLRGLVNLHPAYASVLVDFDPLRVSPSDFLAALEVRAARAGEEALPEGRAVRIPVRYGGAGGPDLDDVARHTGLSVADVVALHASVEYLVCFLGFSPGFAYLSGMPPVLAVPRLSSPRRRVPAGSVAIGGAQTGVYPVSTPGGWRIVGHTALRLFRPEAQPPVLLEMGDRVRFEPVPEAAL